MSEQILTADQLKQLRDNLPKFPAPFINQMVIGCIMAARYIETAAPPESKQVKEQFMVSASLWCAALPDGYVSERLAEMAELDLT